MQLWREQCRQPGIFSPLLPSFTLDISLFRSLQQRERPTFFTLQNPARLRGAPSARGLRQEDRSASSYAYGITRVCESRDRRHASSRGRGRMSRRARAQNVR